MSFAYFIAWLLAFVAFMGQFVAAQIWTRPDVRWVWPCALEIMFISVMTYALINPVMGATILWSLVLGQIFGICFYLVMQSTKKPTTDPIILQAHVLPSEDERKKHGW